MCSLLAILNHDFVAFGFGFQHGVLHQATEWLGECRLGKPTPLQGQGCFRGWLQGAVTVTVEDVADHGTGFVHRRFTILQHGNLADGTECTTEGLIEKLESSLPSPRPIQ